MFDSPKTIPSNTFIFSAIAMVHAFESAIDLCLQILNLRDPPPVNPRADAGDGRDTRDARDARDALADALANALVDARVDGREQDSMDA